MIDRLIKIFINTTKNASGYLFAILLLTSTSTFSKEGPPKQDFLNQLEAIKWTNIDSAMSFLEQEMVTAKSQAIHSTAHFMYATTNIVVTYPILASQLLSRA